MSVDDASPFGLLLITWTLHACKHDTLDPGSSNVHACCFNHWTRISRGALKDFSLPLPGPGGMVKHELSDTVLQWSHAFAFASGLQSLLSRLISSAILVVEAVLCSSKQPPG